MHKLVENGGSVNSDTKVTFKFQRGLVSRKMALPQQKMAIRLREIANVLDREVEVRPNILDDVQEFITKFPMAEVPTYLEDNTSRLPPEVLEHILHFLPPQDLKAAVQVSKGWKGVGLKPKLWKWAKVIAIPGLDGNLQMMRSPRAIRTLEAVDLTSQQVQRLTLAVADDATLEEVNLEGSSMELVGPDLLSSAVTNLVKLNLAHSNLNEEQVAALFSFMTSGCKISSLNLEEVNLSSVDPELMACAGRLAELNLSETLLTTEQTRILWNAIGEHCNFSSFHMRGIDLGNVEPEVLSQVAKQASKIGFCNTSLTGEQAASVISALDQNDLLEEVDLGDISLTGVESGLFAKAVSRTKRLSLINAGLTTDQVTLLLQALSEKCQIENLDLSANDLSMIEADLMAESINKLKIVTLYGSSISVNQVSGNCQIPQKSSLVLFHVSAILRRGLGATSLTSFWA